MLKTFSGEGEGMRENGENEGEGGFVVCLLFVKYQHDDVLHTKFH